MTTLAEQLAQRALAKRTAVYTAEVERLIEAGRRLMLEDDGGRGPRVADIVTAAGLSNDAFYRHFPSKGALVAAVVQDGALRLRDHLERRMAKERDPRAQVRQWVRGILGQAEGEVARQIRAVLLHSAEGAGDPTSSRSVGADLGELLVQPLSALGAPHPQLLARLAGHGTLGLLSQHLTGGTAPDRSEVDAVVDSWVAAATGSRGPT